MIRQATRNLPDELRPMATELISMTICVARETPAVKLTMIE